MTRANRNQSIRPAELETGRVPREAADAGVPTVDALFAAQRGQQRALHERLEQSGWGVPNPQELLGWIRTAKRYPDLKAAILAELRAMDEHDAGDDAVES